MATKKIKLINKSVKLEIEYWLNVSGSIKEFRYLTKREYIRAQGLYKTNSCFNNYKEKTNKIARNIVCDILEKLIEKKHDSIIIFEKVKRYKTNHSDYVSFIYVTYNKKGGK